MEQTSESSETTSFTRDAALDHLKELGSVSKWKKEFKDEYHAMKKADELESLCEEAGLTPKKSKKVVEPAKVIVTHTSALAIQEILKQRGLKKLDMNALIDEALEQVPQSFWDDKQEELTPMDWKIQRIAENPQLRDALDKHVNELLSKVDGQSH